MSAVDQELIRRKLGQLENYLKKLERFRSLDRNAYVSNDDNYGLAEHWLQLAIEATLDVCRALVLGLDLKMPDEAQNLFTLLRDAKVLTPEFVERNQSMVGFCNLLVHEYAEVDHSKTYDYLQEHTDDLSDFIEQIKQYMAS